MSGIETGRQSQDRVASLAGGSIDALVDQIAERVAIVSVNKLEETFKKFFLEEKEKVTDRRRFNVQLLLEHYHDIRRFCEDAVYDVVTAQKATDVDTLSDEEAFDMMTRIISKHDAKLDDLEKSTAETYLRMRQVQTQLAGYREDCESSPNESVQRRWRVLKARYIDKPVTPVKEIARAEFVDERTVRRDIKACIEDLTPRMFGIDGIDKLISRYAE